MPRWITNEKGLWFPARERVALTNHSEKSMVNPSATWSNYYGQMVGPGEAYIYEGPDRAALEQLFEEGVGNLGSDFHNDPDLITRVRQLGYKDVEEFARVMGWDEKKAKERFEKLAAVTAPHEISKKVEAINKIGGGKDFSGQGKDKFGGFGELPEK